MFSCLKYKLKILKFTVAVPMIKESSASNSGKKPEELICPWPEQSYASDNCLRGDSCAASQTRNVGEGFASAL